jgi:hypothetical protein
MSARGLRGGIEYIMESENTISCLDLCIAATSRIMQLVCSVYHTNKTTDIYYTHLQKMSKTISLRQIPQVSYLYLIKENLGIKIPVFSVSIHW